MTTPHNSKKQRRKAFTLLETLTALTLSILLTALMLRLFADTTQLWQQSSSRLDTMRDAHAALKMMSADLSSLKAAPEAPSDFPILAIQAHPESDPQTHWNDELYALVPMRNSGSSDLCAVGYYCAWDPVKNGYVLRRQISQSDAVYAALHAASEDRATPKTPFLSRFHPRDAPSEELASYVWDLQFRMPDPERRSSALPRHSALFNRRLPPWVEIRFKALSATDGSRRGSSQAAPSLWLPEATSSTGPLGILQRQFLCRGQQFATRVRIAQ
jgi:type II secretory pathway pseudopilin PulG